MFISSSSGNAEVVSVFPSIRSRIILTAKPILLPLCHVFLKLSSSILNITTVLPFFAIHHLSIFIGIYLWLWVSWLSGWVIVHLGGQVLPSLILGNQPSFPTKRHFRPLLRMSSASGDSQVPTSRHVNQPSIQFTFAESFAYFFDNSVVNFDEVFCWDAKIRCLPIKYVNLHLCYLVVGHFVEAFVFRGLLAVERLSLVMVATSFLLVVIVLDLADSFLVVCVHIKFTRSVFLGRCPKAFLFLFRWCFNAVFFHRHYGLAIMITGCLLPVPDVFWVTVVPATSRLLVV